MHSNVVFSRSMNIVVKRNDFIIQKELAAQLITQFVFHSYAIIQLIINEILNLHFF
jgi:hypothetical protein